MPRVVNQYHVDATDLDALDTPRDNWLVGERDANADGVFEAHDGPFTQWKRKLTVEESETSTGLTPVVETIDYELALPAWKFAASWLISWQLRRPDRTEAPFWAPPQRFDARGARTFAWLIFAALGAAYLGTLLSQTMTFVAKEFGEGTATQGYVTSMTRGGALISLAVVAQADRVGRRRMLLAAGTLSTLFAVLTAFAPSIWVFGASQTISRGFATAFGIMIGILAAEESPAGSRAWTASVLIRARIVRVVSPPGRVTPLRHTRATQQRGSSAYHVHDEAPVPDARSSRLRTCNVQLTSIELPERISEQHP